LGVIKRYKYGGFKCSKYREKWRGVCVHHLRRIMGGKGERCPIKKKKKARCSQRKRDNESRRFG